MTAVSTTVRCNGHMHRIVLTKSGRLVLVDHPDLKAERALVALGGKKCRCLEVLDAWRRRDIKSLPDVLKTKLREAADVAARRETASRAADRLAMPLAARMEERLCELAMSLLPATRYWWIRTAFASEYVHRIRIGPPAIGSSRWLGYSQNKTWLGTFSEISVSIPASWYHRVYRRGIAVVDGCFVLDVLGEDEGGIRVLAGRQGPGYKVYPAQALITPAGRLIWLEEGS